MPAPTLAFTTPPSMNERQYRQLILSETVEGLSVIAISYYLLSLLGYLIKAWHDAGTAPLPVTAMMAIAVPITLAVVFLAVRTIRRRILGRRNAVDL